jgi:hypothetical protein
MLDVILKTNHRSNDGTIYHTQEPAQWHMSDFNYMLPPFLAAAGEFNEAMKQIEGNRKFLYHPKENCIPKFGMIPVRNLQGKIFGE